jgi:hypothetical protein
MPSGGGYDVTGLAVKVTREGIDETSRDLKELARSADKAEQQVDQLGRESKQTSREVRGIGDGAERATVGMKGMIGAAAGLAAAYLAVRKLSEAWGAAIDAASEQERIFAGLGVALGNAGVNYEALAGHLDSYFAMLQKTTIYGDTESAEVLRSLVVVTGDYNSAMKLLEPTLQFSAAMHIDVATAARLAGQAATGMTGTLSRYGIILSQTTKDQLAMADATGKANIVADLLNAKFAGTAQAELQTYGGALDQVGNYAGDLSEAFGDLFIKSEVLPELFHQITDTLTWMIDAANTTGDALAYMEATADFSEAAKSVESLKQALSGLGAGVNIANLETIWVFLSHFVAGEVASRILNAAKAINALDGALEAIAARGPSIAAISEGLAEGWSRTTDVIFPTVKSHENLAEQIARVNAESQANLASIYNLIDGFDKMKAATVKTTAAIDPFLDNLAKEKAAIELMQQPVERFEEMMGDMGEESSAVADQALVVADAMLDLATGSIPEMSAALAVLVEEWAALVKLMEEPVEVEFPEPPPDATASWVDSFDDIQRSFADMLGKGFTGELESFSDFWDEIWKDLAKNAVSYLMAAFASWLRGEQVDAEGNPIGGTGSGNFLGGSMNAGQTAGMVLGGAGMIGQSTQEGGWGGALTGAMGGAMVGLPWAVATGGLSVVVGAIVGGIIGYFSGGGDTRPTTSVSYIGPGMAWNRGETGITTTGQEMSAREDRLLTMAIGQLYRGIAGQWREMLRGFGDSELFDLLREAPTIVDESFRMTAQELEAWLAEDQLPRLFQRQYREAIRAGLRDLDMAGPAITQMFAELRDMPGTERMDALVSLVTALVAFSDALAMDWEALTVEAGKGPMDVWIDSMGEAGDAMALLTTGWEDMRLIDRAADLEQIGNIFGQVTQSTIVMLRALEQIARTLDAAFGQTIEGFTTRGMSEDELWGYYEERYNYYNTLMQQTDDPNLILEYTQQMLRILNLASGMLTNEQWLAPAGGTGMTWQEWFLSVTESAQTAADEAVQNQIDRAQEVYDQLWLQMQTTQGLFQTLDDAVEPVEKSFADLPDVMYDFSDAVVQATGLLNGVNDSLALFSSMINSAAGKRTTTVSRVSLGAIS